MDGLSRQDAVEWLKSLEMMATFILERITEAPPQPQLPSSQYSSFDGVSLLSYLHDIEVFQNWSVFRIIREFFRK